MEVYFRIEDTENSNGINRIYQIPYEDLPLLNKQNVECYIAEEIKKEVNGSKDRKLLSYSKSLGVALLKYNKHVDNGLHICCVDNPLYENSIHYITSEDNHKCKRYTLAIGLSDKKLFKGNEKIKLCNFVINIANNSSLTRYLKKYTEVGLKPRSSPEKDIEIIMMQAQSDIVIKRYIDSIYILHSLQLKYNFLKNKKIACDIIKEIMKLEELVFEGCEEERDAIILLVKYLYLHKEYEFKVNPKILNYVEKNDYLSFYYDPISQYVDIMHNCFEYSYNLRDYNKTVVSEIFWRYCKKYK